MKRLIYTSLMILLLLSAIRPLTTVTAANTNYVSNLSGTTPTPTPTLTASGVIFYQDADWGGTASQTFIKGTYTTAQLIAKGCPDDWMSSLRVPNGWTVIVYPENNFTGTTWVFTRDTNYVGGACDNQMSSCRIQ